MILGGVTMTSCTADIEDNPVIPEPEPEPEPEPVVKEIFELGKPNNDDYRYLDEYKALKEYIDFEKYPNFKLGAGTTVNEYLNKPVYRNMINKNFSETVAGNAMKMASCVDNNGNMNFNTVRNYVNTATEAGLSVYGHTLAWHAQQPKGWLLRLMADKPDPKGGEEYVVIARRISAPKRMSAGTRMSPLMDIASPTTRQTVSRSIAPRRTPTHGMCSSWLWRISMQKLARPTR